MRPRLIIKAKLYNILQFYSNKHFVKTNGLLSKEYYVIISR